LGVITVAARLFAPSLNLAVVRAPAYTCGLQAFYSIYDLMVSSLAPLLYRVAKEQQRLAFGMEVKDNFIWHAQEDISLK
jgi:hypothetical protein